MSEQARSKLKAEMDQNKNNSYVQVVGDYLIAHLDKYPQDAAKINADGKTILKSLDEMRKAASKKKTGNCVVLAPQEGFDIVIKYYGIKESSGLPAAPPRQTAAPKPKSREIDFDVNLDDFL